MKITKFNKYAIGLIVTFWILSGISVFNFASANAQESGQQTDIYRKIRLFNEVLFRLQQNYIYEPDINDLVDSAIDGMLSDLDVHTTFFRPDDFKEFRTGTEGKFGGLGISIDKQGEYITVISPIEGTPAYKMGILAGDRIVKVDGENIVGFTTNEAIKRMRGDVGTRVVISVERPGVSNLLEFEIIRDLIEIKSIPYAFVLDNGVGYLRIRQFNANTSRELREALDELEDQGIRGLLIDLRFNPGGLLNEAIDTVNEFVGKGKKVVFTKGRNPAVNQDYYTKYDRIRAGYPIVVLINEASASASEIFAGSMQDWDKGLVVGKTSFGKGSVQQLLPLDSGYGLKITTSKYYIHSGRTIHKDENERLLRGEEFSEEELEEIERLKREQVFYTEAGRIVYGGGGITPDIEIEQRMLTRFQIELRRQNLFFEFSINYLLENEDIVDENFEVDDSVYGKFVDLIREREISFTEDDLAESEDWIRSSITSNIISRKFGDIEGYKVGMNTDTQLQEALSFFEKFDSLQEMFDYAEDLKEQ